MRSRRRGMSRLKFLFAAVFTIILAVPVQGAVMLDRVVAVVNQDVITWSELYRAMEIDASPDVKAMSPGDKRKVFKEEEGHFLESLIDLRLELQQAGSEGLSVSDEEVKEAVDSIKKKYSMTDSELEESLNKEGYSVKEYRRRLGEQILASRVVNRDVRSKIVVSDSDVLKYMKEHEKELEDSGGYRISQIFFKMPESAEEKDRIEKKAAELVEKMGNGESFSDLAKKYSEDPSADSGGDLGFIKKGQLSKEFREEVSKMKPGDVSKPFWTDSGLHIIKLDERTDPKSANEIKEKARDELTKKLFKAKYDEWVKTLRSKAFIEVKL
ncbi:MAG: peptidylprolyl isomerase [Candidatus Sulfobium sp.]